MSKDGAKLMISLDGNYGYLVGLKLSLHEILTSGKKNVRQQLSLDL
ncbi:MAG: hypothetical protein KDD58_06130 [Bdellovibrionales bacterium]|nr:hypothetical protein [Bdellovibrionales bacterium]